MANMLYTHNDRIQGLADLQQQTRKTNDACLKDRFSKNRSGSQSLGMHCYVITDG